MKRWMLVLLVVFAVAAIGGAGYLGMQSGKEEPPPTVQAPTTVAVTRGGVRQTVTAPGQIVGVRQFTLAMEASGKLAEINVRPGEKVQAGAVLARLDPAPLAQEVATAQADLELARARLEKLKAGPSETDLAAAQLDLAQAEANLNQLTAGASASDLAAARAAIQAAQTELENARQNLVIVQKSDIVSKDVRDLEYEHNWYEANYGEYKKKYEQGQVDKTRLDLEWNALLTAKERLDSARAQAALALSEANARVARAEESLRQAQADLAELQKAPDPEKVGAAELGREKALAQLEQLGAGPSEVDLKQAEAAVWAADLALQKAQIDLEAAALTAPFDGIVLEVKANPGDTVGAGAGLIVLMDTAAIEIKATVIEEDLPLVQVGQQVELFFDAQPDATVSGLVARIVPQRTSGDRPLYPIYITVDDLPEGLLAGMTADASIILDQRENVLRLPRAVVRARADGTATVEVWTGTQTEARTVQVGLRGDLNVEILGGLHEGDQVVAE